MASDEGECSERSAVPSPIPSNPPGPSPSYAHQLVEDWSLEPPSPDLLAAPSTKRKCDKYPESVCSLEPSSSSSSSSLELPQARYVTPEPPQVEYLEVALQTPQSVMDHEQDNTTQVSPDAQATEHALIFEQASEITFKTPKDAAWVTGELKNRGLFQDDYPVLDGYPEFKNLVRSILDRPRHSMMDTKVDPEEYNCFRRTHSIHQADNEDTVLEILLPFIYKDKRQVLKVHEDGKEEWISEAFVTNRLFKITNQEFHRDLTPSWNEQIAPLSGDLQKAMQKDSKTKNPKPDRAFGTATDQLNLPGGLLLSENIRYALEVMPNLHFPFLVIEGTAARGSLIEAKNQACRAGATLVNAARILLARTGEADVSPGPDDRTFVFSATVDPNLMIIWCHWAEIPEPGTDRKVRFHMSRLADRAFVDEDQFGQLRKNFHNILDWGVGERVQEKVKVWYEKIVEYEKEQQKGGKLGGQPPNKRKKVNRQGNQTGGEAAME